MDVHRFTSVFLLISACVSAVALAKYEIPEVLLEQWEFRGFFSVLIPAKGGNRRFSFNGNTNEEFNGSEDVQKVKNDGWSFTRLKPGNILSFWTSMTYFHWERKLEYLKYNQMFAFSGRTRTTTPKSVNLKTSCVPSQTIANNKVSCSGRLLFEENFEDFETNEKWTKEVIYAGEPDYEFVIYTDDSRNIYTNNNILHIKPTLTEDTYGESAVRNRDGLDLDDRCTGMIGTRECFQKPEMYFILPPVLSARITTRENFSFLYGRVEIRAKLPKGDWIYPELFLNPANQKYGAGYESGQIRIAFLPGNHKLGKTLSGGCVLGNSTEARKFAMRSINSVTNWYDDFHVFSMTWQRGLIMLYVDNKSYGYIYPVEGGFSSLREELDLTAAYRWDKFFAPFDIEMYLTIGVGVGGHNFNDCPSKPWINKDPKAQIMFYRARDVWYPTWDEDSVLQVDYIKVFAS